VISFKKRDILRIIMKTEIKLLLKEYGLDKNEIEVYLHLVGNKELTAYKIAKDTKIHRSTCYDVLERLIVKGFVNLVEKENKKYYSANEISRVISQLKDKETILLSIIPKLQSIEKKQEINVRILEEAKGQKQFNFGLFNLIKNKEISFCYIIGNTYASNISSNLFIERLIKDIKNLQLKKKIKYEGIWDEKFRGDKLVLQYNKIGENKFLKNLPSKVGTIITDKFIAFLYTHDKSYVVEIKNKLISQELKVYFENLWEIAKK